MVHVPEELLYPLLGPRNRSCISNLFLLPDAAFLATISEPLYSVIDVDADTDPKSCPIATGPFMVKDFEVDTFIEMERYDGYWNGPSQIDSVTLKCIADDSTRALAIQSGEIDLMQRIGANDVATFKDNPSPASPQQAYSQPTQRRTFTASSEL